MPIELNLAEAASGEDDDRAGNAKMRELLERGLDDRACADVAKHTKHPDGYVDRSRWAQQKLKTHEQRRCPTCGFWVVWVKRKVVLPVEGGGR